MAGADLPFELHTGKGHHFGAPTRQHIAHCVFNLDMTGPADTQRIVDTVFLEEKPNLQYLRRVVTTLIAMPQESRILYVLGPLARGGNKRKLSSDELDELLELRRRRKQLRLGSLTSVFNERFPCPLPVCSSKGRSAPAISTTLRPLTRYPRI